MRRHRYQLNLFAYCDGDRVCRHMERMAARGWYLDRAGLLWRYRRSPAQAMHYAAVYCDGAEPGSPVPGEGAQALVDYCAQTGWTLAAQWEQMLLFSTPLPHPVPVDTDPEVQLESMHRVMKKLVRRWTAVCAVWLALMIPLAAAVLRGAPVRLLADPILQGTLALLLLSPLILLLEPLAYLWWHRRARRAAELGQPWPPFFRWPAALGALAVASLVVLAAARAVTDPADGWPSLLRLLCTFLCILLLRGLLALLRQAGTQDGFRLAATAAAAFLLVLVLNRGLDPALARLSDRGFFGGSVTTVTRTFGRTTQTDYLRQDPVPLALRDLTGETRGQWSRELDRYSSPLLTLTQVRERAPFEAADLLVYEVAEVHIPSLTPKVLELVMEDHQDKLDWKPDPRSSFRPVDTALWPEGGVLQRWRDENPLPAYLLWEGNTIVWLSFAQDLELTPQRLDTIRTALFS